MSGPKVSEAELRQMRLDDLISKENVKIEALKKKIWQLNRVICHFTKQKDEVVARFNQFLDECDDGQKNELKLIYDIFESEFNNIVTSIDYHNVCGIDDAIDKITQSDCINRFWSSVIDMKNALNESKILFSNDFIPECIDVHIAGKDVSSEGVYDYIIKLENPYNADERQWAEKLINQIDILITGDEFIGDDAVMLSKYRTELIGIISGEKLKTSERLSISEISAFVKKIANYVEIYHTYVSYAMELGLEVSPITCFYTAGEIESEKCILEKHMSDTLSRNYIEDSINKVMRRHGYNIDSKHHVVGRASNTIANNIDNIYENDDTHIRVYSASSGHTVMEIVGNCSSEEEMRKRYNEQVAFCSLYPEIIEELERDYDIIINVKKNMDPQYTCKELEGDTKTNGDEFSSTRKKDKEIEKSMR